jgi:pimeloyl-ACP methyl ester carboxylesterase
MGIVTGMRQTAMFGALMIVTFLCACGCESEPRDISHIIFVVPGVGGNVGGMKTALENNSREVRVVTWGAPAPLFFLNFSNKQIHDAAEQKLAKTIAQWKAEHADGEVDLVGHSAGCGVILGALNILDDTKVNRVVLLAPSVSPTYDLDPAIEKIAGQLHVFYSDQDRLFLGWRTNHFGTYDRIKTRAAGNRGFVGDYSSEKLVQHSYQPQWRELGNDGGHFGTISEKFVREIVAPLLSD